MSHIRSNVYDLVVDQGATLQRVFAIKNSAKRTIELTDYTARMQVRSWDEASRDPVSEITAEYTTENGYLEIIGSAGQVSLLVPPGDIAIFEPKAYVYDVEVESPTGETTRIIQGKFIVRPEVTR
jgi:hypothetical protein